MATSFDQLCRELRGFRDAKAITKACGKGIRRAADPARKAIKKAAVDQLPKRGGLNVWVSGIRITVRIKLSGRRAGITLRGGRNSAGGRTDTSAIDRGRVRAPSWGRRRRGDWHNVTVTPGFFTRTAAELPDWRANIDSEVDQALETLRTGR